MPRHALTYIANTRFPSEKAHALQIFSMCGAFAAEGLDVTLAFPARRQPAGRERDLDPFTYWSAPATFELAPELVIEAHALERFLPAPLWTTLFFCHACAWGRTAVRAARRRGSSVIFTRDVPAAHAAIARGLATVLELHTVPRFAERVLVRLIARNPSLLGIVTMTRFIATELERLGCDGRRIVVLPDAVDPQRFSALPERDAARRELGLPSTGQFVGYVGRFETLGMEKGLKELIGAAALLSSSHPELRLLCVGGPDELVPRYAELARAAGLSDERVIFRGHQPFASVPLWIRSCDVVTIPWPWSTFSAYYTSPMKLFEYLACGVPIVASDLPALREVLRGGENAVLVRPGDPAALAGGIESVLGNPGLGSLLAGRGLSDVTSHTWDNRARTIIRQFLT